MYSSMPCRPAGHPVSETSELGTPQDRIRNSTGSAVNARNANEAVCELVVSAAFWVRLRSFG